jgi:hypothetical protein
MQCDTSGINSRYNYLLPSELQMLAERREAQCAFPE